MFPFKGFIIRNNFWLKVLSLGTASGITIFPFIFIGKKSTDRLILVNHERIHIRQQIELLFLGFIILYFVEYFINRMKMDAHAAYRAFSLEREAYANDQNLNYLNTRKTFAFIKYYKK